MSDFEKRLIDIQLAIVEGYENLQEDAPFEFKKLASDVLHVQRNILRKVGYSEKKKSKQSNPPPKDLFKNTSPTDGEVLVDFGNKNVNNSAFDKKSLNVDTETHEVKNKNINKVAFDKKGIEEPLSKKSNPKRLSKDQISNIKRLASEGFNAIQISDELNIVVDKIKSHLSSKSKQTPNVLATSSKKGLEDEVREYKKNKQ